MPAILFTKPVVNNIHCVRALRIASGCGLYLAAKFLKGDPPYVLTPTSLNEPRQNCVCHKTQYPRCWGGSHVFDEVDILRLFQEILSTEESIVLLSDEELLAFEVLAS